MAIKLQNVEFKYSALAPKTLKDVSLEIKEKDEFVFILGHTGSGKSTVVQNMNALLLPCMGNIYVYDKAVIMKMKHPLKLNTKKNRLKYNFEDNKKMFAHGNKPSYNPHLKDLRKHIGLVFQFPEYQLFDSTVLKDVMFGPKNFGYSIEEATKLAKDACKLVGLSENLLEKSPFNLSGGQMRRVAIAGILALNPDIIILDEPTVGLDPKGKDDLMELLVNIQNETHKSIIMISHDMDIVGKYAKRIIVMNKGKVVYDGKKRPLFESREKLYAFNLDLPNSAHLALELKNRGLIEFNHLPLFKEELEKVILGGSIDE